MNHRVEGERVRFTEPATGQDIDVARADITAVNTLPASPMPATFESALSEFEFFDLLQYLRSPAQ